MRTILAGLLAVIALPAVAQMSPPSSPLPQRNPALGLADATVVHPWEVSREIIINLPTDVRAGTSWEIQSYQNIRTKRIEGPQASSAGTVPGGNGLATSQARAMIWGPGKTELRLTERLKDGKVGRRPIFRFDAK